MCKDQTTCCLHEQGDPEGEILGIRTELEDEKDEENKRMQQLHTVFSALWYKGKAVITGAVLKQVLLLDKLSSPEHIHL